MSSIDHAWIDRCLGAGKTVPWTEQLIVAAVAAARTALDGASTVPAVEPPWHCPERGAEVTWAVASAALAAKRDFAPALIDRAFAEANAISVDWKRDRLLAWGALELGADAARADAWAAAIKKPDYGPELAAQAVVRRAHATGHASVAALPAMWGVMTDVEYWPGYPRWLGSAAMTAAVALAAPIADAPALVEEAERLTTGGEEWRQNREYRALALAWARAGDLERAFAAASRMPGTERSEAIVALLDDFGDANDLDVARLEAMSRRALAATRSAPLVVTQPGTDPSEVADTIAQIVEGAVAAALVRRHIARGDLRTAAAAVDAMPEGLTARDEAALQVACARKAKGEIALDAVVAALPGRYAANLAEAAALMGANDVVAAVLGAPRARLTAHVGRRLLQAGKLDAALALAGGFPDPDSELAAELHGELTVMFARAGRAADALAALRAIPAQELKTYEELVTAAGYRAVVVLVGRGDVAGAKALDAELAPRLARIATMEEDS